MNVSAALYCKGVKAPFQLNAPARHQVNTLEHYLGTNEASVQNITCKVRKSPKHPEQRKHF